MTRVKSQVLGEPQAIDGRRSQLQFSQPSTKSDSNPESAVATHLRVPLLTRPLNKRINCTVPRARQPTELCHADGISHVIAHVKRKPAIRSKTMSLTRMRCSEIGRFIQKCT